MNCPECGAGNADTVSACTSCGAQLLPIAPGTVLAGRYEIQALLGSGALGRVYRARDRTLEEVVAVKVLDPETTRSPEHAQRFRNEIRLARRVRHVNVCAIHEYVEEGPLRFVAMELVDGDDLRRTLHERGPLPPSEAFDVALQVARGLAAIHDAGVIHRDLKPSNIVRDRNGVVRLLDFGVAKHSTPTGTLALTGVQKVVGTPEYMSPEQIRGDDLDPRSDLYSFGVVLFELLTGTLPFEGKTPLDTMLRHVSEPPPLYGERAARIPPGLISVLRRLLLKDPGGRPGSARELEAELLFAQPSAFPEPAADTSIAPPPLPALPAPTPPPLPSLTPPPLPAVEAPPRREPPLADRTEVLPRRPGARRPTPPPPPVVVARDAAAAAALDPERTYVELPPASRKAEAPLPQPPPLPGSVPAPPAPQARRPWMGLGALAAIALAVIALALALRALGPRKGADTATSTEPVEASPPAGSPEPSLPFAEVGPSAPPTTTPAGPAAPTPAPAATPAPRPSAPAPSATPTLPAPTPAPTPRPRREVGPAVVVSTPTPLPTPSPTPTPVVQARLDIVVRPWAQVEVDGKPYGRTPLDHLSLEPGEHSVELDHPEYWPRRRVLALAPGETVRLDVDLAWEAVPRRRGTEAPNRLPPEGAPSDADVDRAAAQVTAGDYREAIATLAAATRRLQAQPGRHRELARAFFYQGVAYLELDQAASATASFAAAIKHDGKLRPAPDAFSPKVLGFFGHVRAVVREQP